MKIAHILPYTAHFPLRKHNGRYEWVLRLVTLQIAQGHQVTLYAAPGSTGGAAGLEWRSHPDQLADKTANNLANMRAAFKQPDFDVYHSHFDFLHYQLANETTKPLVATQHWFPNAQIQQAAQMDTAHHVSVVPVTRFMAETDRQLGIDCGQVIYHGIDLELFRFNSRADSSRFIFVGRISPSKGVKQAVELAQMAGIELDIVGKVNQVDQAYWQTILPLVDGQQIRYLGPKTQAEVATLLADARALLFPNQQTEAFGQTIIEAQACGTPVIAQDLGANSELIKQHETGFVANSPEEYLAAIKNIGQLSRATCRTFAEQFDMHDMADQYLALYRHLM